jgi:hypothetical protein
MTRINDLDLIAGRHVILTLLDIPSMDSVGRGPRQSLWGNWLLSDET